MTAAVTAKKVCPTNCMREKKKNLTFPPTGAEQMRRHSGALERSAGRLQQVAERMVAWPNQLPRMDIPEWVVAVQPATFNLSSFLQSSSLCPRQPPLSCRSQESRPASHRIAS